mmetsp:Transcript_6916/g.30392  ORF Transcript_6916/g.30392 Transcript_6916/m.30392 type:complete len:241 (-) Transcript_6916:201-923(-)
MVSTASTSRGSTECPTECPTNPLGPSCTSSPTPPRSRTFSRLAFPTLSASPQAGVPIRRTTSGGTRTSAPSPAARSRSTCTSRRGRTGRRSSDRARITPRAPSWRPSRGTRGGIDASATSPRHRRGGIRSGTARKRRRGRRRASRRARGGRRSRCVPRLVPRVCGGNAAARRRRTATTGTSRRKPLRPLQQWTRKRRGGWALGVRVRPRRSSPSRPSRTVRRSRWWTSWPGRASSPPINP